MSQNYPGDSEFLNEFVENLVEGDCLFCVIKEIPVSLRYSFLQCTLSGYMLENG